MSGISRRSFVKAVAASPFLIGVKGGAQKVTYGDRGFLLPIEHNLGLDFIGKMSEAYTEGAEKLGANSVAFQARHQWDGTRLINKSNDDFVPDYVKQVSDAAKKRGLNRYLWTTTGAADENPPRGNEVAFLDALAEKSIEFAKIADREGIERYAPFSEVELFVPDKNQISSFARALAPELRKVYGGELIPKITSEITPQGVDSTDIDLRAYDAIGLEMYPGGATSTGDYASKAVKALNKANAFSASQGLGKVLVAEAGLPVGGNIDNPARGPEFIDYVNGRANGNITEAVQADGIGKLLPAIEGMHDGVYLFGFGKGINPWAVDGRPAGEKVRKYWNGTGPITHPDKAPSFSESFVRIGGEKFPEVAPVTEQYTATLTVAASDVSGPQTIKDSFSYEGPDGKTYPNSDGVVHSTATLFDRKGQTLLVNGQRPKMGDVPKSQIVGSWKATVEDVNGNKTTKTIIPEEWVPQTRISYQAGGKFKYEVPYRNGDSTLRFSVSQDAKWGAPDGHVKLELLDPQLDKIVWTYEGPSSKTSVKLSEGKSQNGGVKARGDYVSLGHYFDNEIREARLPDGQIIKAEVQDFTTFQPTQFT